MKKLRLLIAAFLISSLFGSMAFAQMQDTTATDVDDDFFEMSLEDLLNMEVTSVSKKAERLQDVASSIYVLTAEDIMRTGATSLHEVLRTVPGYWGVQEEYSMVEPEIRSSPSWIGSGSVLYLLDGTPVQGNMSSQFTFFEF